MVTLFYTLVTLSHGIVTLDRLEYSLFSGIKVRAATGHYFGLDFRSSIIVLFSECLPGIPGGCFDLNDVGKLTTVGIPGFYFSGAVLHKTASPRNRLESSRPKFFDVAGTLGAGPRSFLMNDRIFLLANRNRNPIMYEIADTTSVRGAMYQTLKDDDSWSFDGQLQSDSLFESTIFIIDPGSTAAIIISSTLKEKLFPGFTVEVNGRLVVPFPDNLQLAVWLDRDAHRVIRYRDHESIFIHVSQYQPRDQVTLGGSFLRNVGKVVFDSKNDRIGFVLANESSSLFKPMRIINSGIPLFRNIQAGPNRLIASAVRRENDQPWILAMWYISKSDGDDCFVFFNPDFSETGYSGIKEVLASDVEKFSTFPANSVRVGKDWKHEYPRGWIMDHTLRVDDRPSFRLVCTRARRKKSAAEIMSRFDLPPPTIVKKMGLLDLLGWRRHHSPNDEDCSICFQRYRGREMKQRTNCGHEYHYKCIAAWLESHSTCPLCRQTV